MNGRLEELGEDPLNEIKLYQRLEKMNSQLQSVCKADPREINRVKWLTHLTQGRTEPSYIRGHLCQKIFARLPADKEEQERKGHVVSSKDSL
jgi:hypothetical protein